MTQLPKALSQATLDQISKEVSIPKYNRSALTTGIVHIGVGGFHRAHQAYYMHQLFNKELAHNWGIIGVGLMERDRAMYEALNGQDGLYTLVVQHPEGSVDAEVIGAIQKMHLAIDEAAEVIDLLASPETKIISLTITEGGYNFDPNTEEFIFDNPDIEHDLTHPDSPKTVFGYLTTSFLRRYELAAKGVTVLSCDNVQHNGDMAKKCILAFAKAQNPKLADWIETHVSFPNAMVDRITPVTTAETRNYISKNFNITDAAPVNCEPFIQWVIEDNFIQGRPPLEEVGVQFVEDVTAYEHMKLRLLNAGHSVVGITGAIHGYPTIDACVQDETIAQFLRTYLNVEATPMLAPVAGINVDEYIDTLITRFSNPNIKDSVGRICSESSAKLPKFLIPTILDNLKKEGSIRLGTFVLAAWCYYNDKQVNEKGEELEILDVLANELHRYAKKTESDNLAFLDLEVVFGDLKNNERFVQTYKEMITLIYQEQDILASITQV